MTFARNSCDRLPTTSRAFAKRCVAFRCTPVRFNGYAVIPPIPSPHTQQSVPKTSAPWNVAGTSAPWNAQGTSALGNEMGTSAPWNAKGTSALWNATRPTTVQVANDPQGSKPTPNNDPKESQPAPTNPQAINDAKGATPAGTRAGRLLSTS